MDAKQMISMKVSMLSSQATRMKLIQEIIVRLVCVEGGLVAAQGVELAEVQDAKTGQEVLLAAVQRSKVGTGAALEPGIRIA